MAGKPDTNGRMGGVTKAARDALIGNVRSMFAWIGPRAARLTLTEVLEQHYFAFANVRPKTKLRYLCEVRRWDRLAGNPRLCDITVETFRVFRERAIAEDLAPSSYEGSVKIVKALLRFSRDCGWIKAMPMTGKPSRIDPPIPDPATIDEIELLYRFADHASRPAKGTVAPADWWRCFLCIELWTGLRISDIGQRFAWSDIREDHIRFRASKTGRLHTFPRCHVVDAHLDLVRGFEAKLVLGYRRVSVEQLIRMEMDHLCREAGIRHLTPQQLRQACVTNWLSCGESAGRIVHGAGLTVAEKHYASRLVILRNAMDRFQWPPSMERFALDNPATPQTLRIDERA